MLHLCPIQSGFDIISTPEGVVNGFLSILQRKTSAFFLPVGKPDLRPFLRRRPAPPVGTLRWAPFLRVEIYNASATPKIKDDPLGKFL